MSDATWSVKVPQSVRDQITVLHRESGLQGKDFVANLLKLYEVQQTMEDTPEVAEDLGELTTITRRINDIYLNMAKRAETLSEAKERELLGPLKEAEETITNLKAKLERSQNSMSNITKSYEEVQEFHRGANARVKELTVANDNMNALNTEYRDRIQELTNYVDELESNASENKELKKEIELLTSKHEKEVNRSEKLESTVETLKSQIEQIKESHKKEIDNLTNENKLSVDNIKERLSVESDRQIIDMEKDCQKEIAEIRDTYNSKLADFQDRIDKIQTSYNDLLNSYKNSIEKVDSEETKVKK